ncbi:MAG: response regulator transcription factor [Bacteroidota bacterium]
MRKPTILIADDHPILLRGLETFLQDHNHNVIATCTDGKTAYNAIVKHKPDISILDIDMPNLTGIEIAKNCKRHNLNTKIILITLHKEKKIYENAMRYNIHGYLLKEFALNEIEVCLEKVINGESYFSKKIYKRFLKTSDANAMLENLTPSEIKILKLVAEEMTSNEIANMLNISPRTVSNHRGNIVKKLKLNPKPNALLIWAQKHKELIE